MNFRLDPMYTGVNSKGSGESGTLHTHIRISYVSIKSWCVQFLKIAIKASTRDLGTYHTCANVTSGGGVVLAISPFENIKFLIKTLLKTVKIKINWFL